MAGISEHVWAKVYLELPTDPKLIDRSAHDCYLWVCLILLAKSGDGLIAPWQSQAKYLSKYARVSLREVAAALVFFEDVGMLQRTPDGGLLLTRFGKRQASSDPSAAERMRTLRERSATVTADSAEHSRTLRHTRARDRGRGEGTTSPSPEETEAEHTPTPSGGDGGVCVSDDGLGAFGDGPPRAPRVPIMPPAPAPRPSEPAYADFEARFRDGNGGHFGDKSEAGRAWFEYVTRPECDPGEVLAALVGYFASSEYADQRARNLARIGAAKWLAQWTDWRPKAAPKAKRKQPIWFQNKPVDPETGESWPVDEAGEPLALEVVG